MWGVTVERFDVERVECSVDIAIVISSFINMVYTHCYFLTFISVMTIPGSLSMLVVQHTSSAA